MRFQGKPYLCASKSAGRYATHGVQFDKAGLDGKPALVATDGRRIVVVPATLDDDEHVPEAPVLLGVDALKAAEKAGRKRTVNGFVALNGAAKVPMAPGAPEFRYIDAEFPRWQAVCPKPDASKRRVCFNAQYLAGIAEALGGENVTLELSDDPTHPIRVTASNIYGGDLEGFGVLCTVTPNK